MPPTTTVTGKLARSFDALETSFFEHGFVDPYERSAELKYAEDDAVRSRSMFNLRFSKDDRALELAVNTMVSDTSPAVRLEALFTADILTQTDPARRGVLVARLIETALLDKSVTSQTAAALLLREIPLRDGTDMHECILAKIEKRISHSDPDNPWAINWVNQTFDSEALIKVLGVMQDSSSATFLACVLPHTRDPEYQAMLLDAIEKRAPDENLRLVLERLASGKCGGDEFSLAGRAQAILGRVYRIRDKSDSKVD